MNCRRGCGLAGTFKAFQIVAARNHCNKGLKKYPYVFPHRCTPTISHTRHDHDLLVPASEASEASRFQKPSLVSHPMDIIITSRECKGLIAL